MVTTVLALLLLAGVALYVMKPEERAWSAAMTLRACRAVLREAKQISPADEPFHDFLRARTRWVFVTPALAAANLVIFARMLFDAGDAGDPGGVIAWGGNIGVRTVDGEWWRLLAATFVHGGVLHLVATLVALVLPGLILERAVGPLAYAAVYLAAAIVSSLTALWTVSPQTVSIGASGAICGLYGLLLAAFVWAIVEPPPEPVPLATVKQIAGAAGFFFLYNLSTGDLGMAAEMAGLATGLGCGVSMACVAGEKPPVRDPAYALAATALVALVAALPLRLEPDRVTPQIVRLVAMEERTADAYDAAVEKFRHRRIGSEALVDLIRDTILPELQAAGGRVRSLHDVPAEHASRVAAAQEYCQVRERSWQRRAEGLLQSDMQMLRQADEAEQAALALFRKVKSES